MPSLESPNVLDYYMFEHDKHMFSSQSGKQRTKKEAELHSNRFDPNGNCRKIVEVIRNSELKNRRKQNKYQWLFAKKNSQKQANQNAAENKN